MRIHFEDPRGVTVRKTVQEHMGKLQACSVNWPYPMKHKERVTRIMPRKTKNQLTLSLVKIYARFMHNAKIPTYRLGIYEFITDDIYEGKPVEKVFRGRLNLAPNFCRVAHRILCEGTRW